MVDKQPTSLSPVRHRKTQRTFTVPSIEKAMLSSLRRCIETTGESLHISSRYQAQRVLYRSDASPTVIELYVEQNSGKEVVVKRTLRAKVVSALQWVSARRELEIHRNLSHPNLVELLDGAETAEEVLLVLEYVPLHDYFTQRIEVNNNPFCAKKDGGIAKFKSFTFDIVSGLAYLHSQGIVHLDLKPGNLLVSKAVDPDQYPLVKLCDLGLARRVGEDGCAAVEKRCGSSFYIAPEVGNQSRVTTGADMWSLGVLLHLMAVGFPPHALRWKPGEDLKFSPRYWRKFESTGLQDFLVCCLRLRPEERLTAVQGLGHPWLQSA